MMMLIWILLPAYNEVNSLPLVMPKLKRVFEQKAQSYRIVVIDDGSTDDSYNILLEMKDKYPLDIVRHKLNRGLGETERDAYEYVAEHAHEDDVLIRLDCDDTHEPAYIFSLLEKLKQGYDVVSASRFQPGGGQKGVGLYRAFVSYAANLFMRLIFNIPGIKDYSCGFRVYRAKVIQDAVRIFGNAFIQLKGLGFTSTLETIVKLKLLGCSFAEVPFVLRYDKKASPSKMVGSVTTLGYFTMALLYHWPFGGWRPFYKYLGETYKRSPDEAYRKFARVNIERSKLCQIGG
jgi:dolichol-phosphate mannosyltransferase